MGKDHKTPKDGKKKKKGLSDKSRLNLDVDEKCQIIGNDQLNSIHNTFVH